MILDTFVFLAVLLKRKACVPLLEQESWDGNHLCLSEIPLAQRFSVT